MALTAKKEEQHDINVIGATRPLAKRAVIMATAARAQGKWLRVFDIRYATAGIPVEITDEDVLFPPGSIEIIETGNLSGPATNFEKLVFPKSVALQSVIHMEICEPNKDK